MANFIEADVIQKIATESEWLTQTRIPYQGQIMLVSDSNGKVTNIKVGDGVNPFADLNYMFDSIQQNAQYVQITSNALPTPVADPAWGMVTGGTYTFGGDDVFTVPDGHWGVANYSSGVWSLVDMGELPMQDISGLTEKGGYEGTAQDLDNKIDNTASDIYKNILDGVVDYDVDLSLTPNRYINNLGDASTTAGDYKATLDYIPLNGSNKIFYKGSVGLAGSRIAFYREPNLITGSFISHFPNENTEFKEGEIEVPEGANYIRATFYNTDTNGARLVLKNYPIPSDDTPLYDFRIIGEPSYDANAVIQSANITWNDGSTGVVTYTDWNESEFTYAGFSATSNENGKVVTQPPVTFNSDGSISNYPDFIISNI